jgi:Ca-activated chloride channel family protein
MNARGIPLVIALAACTNPDPGLVLGASLAPTAAGHRAVPSMEGVLKRVDEKLASLGSGYRPLHLLPQSRPGDDKTLAPYFHISGKEGVESLPLKSTSARAEIAGVIARVIVSQRYENTGKTPIEAVYVFPASTRAAVHGMRMKIGKRTIEAQIEERMKARQTYEQAKEAGKRTSLLEQQRPNVFTMNVANIMPGDRIEVELDYSELIVPTEGTYEFVYPTVVGPRYGGGADPKADRWIANPYLKQGEKEPYGFGFEAHIASPIGIAELSSPSHKVDVKYRSRTSAEVKLAESGGGNRDVVLRYRLAGGKIQSGVLTFEQGGEKYFLVMMEPPARVRPKDIPRREYIFVVDVSGSMYGFPLEVSKQILRGLLGSLSSRDYFNVVLFSGSALTMHRTSVPATAENLEKAISVIDQQRGGGGTELLGALRMAYGIPKVEEKGVSRTVVVVTDGYVGVEAQSFRFIRKNLGAANLFAFGIGSSVNRALIEGMARAGMGQPFVVLNQAEAPSLVEKFQTYIQSPVLTSIKASFEGMEARDVVPESIPDLMSLRPLVLFGKYRGKGGKIRITGVTGAGKFEQVLAIEGASTDKTEPLRILWARKWVETLMDQYALLGESKEIQDAVTDVGLNHKLLTAFTSFVAVDSAVAREGGPLSTVKQPLPLPEGVSSYAVGGHAVGRAIGRGYGYGGGGMAMLKVRRAQSPSLRTSRPMTPMPVQPAAESASRDVTTVARDDDRKAQGRVEVASFQNVRAEHAPRIARLLGRLLFRCLPPDAAGNATLTIAADGRVSLSGGDASWASCLRRAARVLARAIPRLDATRDLVLTLRIRAR